MFKETVTNSIKQSNTKSIFTFNKLKLITKSGQVDKAEI